MQCSAGLSSKKDDVAATLTPKYAQQRRGPYAQISRVAPVSHLHQTLALREWREAVPLATTPCIDATARETQLRADVTFATRPKGIAEVCLTIPYAWLAATRGSLAKTLHDMS